MPLSTMPHRHGDRDTATTDTATAPSAMPHARCLSRLSYMVMRVTLTRDVSSQSHNSWYLRSTAGRGMLVYVLA